MASLITAITWKFKVSNGSSVAHKRNSALLGLLFRVQICASRIAPAVQESTAS